MQVQTKFPRLFREVAIGGRIDGWRVCWIGGWDKCRVLFVVMVERHNAISPDATGPARFPGARLIGANRHHPQDFLYELFNPPGIDGPVHS